MDGYDLNGLELHLSRRNHVAEQFFKADAQATIGLASKARNRIVIQPQVGMMVYYYRRPKGTRHQRVHVGYRGPARVIAVDPPTVRNGTSVVWLSHGGNLVRGSP